MAGSINASIIAKAVYQEDRKAAEDKRREFFRANKVRRPQKKSRWRSGVCKLCNEYFECITFAHAELHGFKHPDDMAKRADFIEWGLY